MHGASMGVHGASTRQEDEVLTAWREEAGDELNGPETLGGGCSWIDGDEPEGSKPDQN